MSAIEEKFDLIIDKIEHGSSLRQSLSDEGISSRSFYEFLECEDETESESRQKRYARACGERADKIFEEMLTIADDGSNDYMTIVKGDMEYNVEDKEVTNRSRLRLDTRKWMLSKMQPKKYGDKIDITTAGDKLTAPIIGMNIINEPKED